MLNTGDDNSSSHPSETMTFLRQYILTACGISLTHDKDYLIRLRLEPVAMTAGCDTLDEFALLETVRKNDISMCGVAPTISMLAYAKKMGAKEARLVKYTTSGETTGDMNEVVGYAGIVVK